MFRNEGFLVRSGRGNTALEVAISSLFVMSGFVWSIELYRDILLTDTVDRVHAAVVRKASKSLSVGQDAALTDAVNDVLAVEGLNSDWSLVGVAPATVYPGPSPLVLSSGRMPMINYQITYQHNRRGREYYRSIYLFTG